MTLSTTMESSSSSGDPSPIGGLAPVSTSQYSPRDPSDSPNLHQSMSEYVSKCANHFRLASIQQRRLLSAANPSPGSQRDCLGTRRGSLGNPSGVRTARNPSGHPMSSSSPKTPDLGEESDEDNVSEYKTNLSRQPKKRLKKSSQEGVNNLDLESDFLPEELEMIRLAGGPEMAQKIRGKCEENVRKGARRLEPRPDRDTILMDKCIQKQPLSDKDFWQKNHGQVLAYAKLMAQENPEYLIHRNSQVNHC